MLSKSLDIRRKPGFTLIEISVSVAVIGFLFLVFEQFFIADYRIYQRNKDRFDIHDQTITAFNYLTPEIRSATSVESCTANSLTIYYLKGSLLNPPQKITYSLDENSQTLNRYLIDPVGSSPTVTYPEDNAELKTISTFVSNSEEQPIFTYFDSSNNELASPCDINLVRMVEINLRHRNNSSRYPFDALDTSKAQFRNLKDNL